MTVLDSTSENRFFEGYLTVEMKDKQGEITVVDELYKVLPIWVDRGAPITDTHSNRVIGKGINFAKTTVTEGGVTYPAIKITGKIHKNYELDTDIWEKIKSGEYKGLSFGGATKANRVPKVMKDGDIAYALTDLEHYEVAVCKDPAVPLALITDYNTLAKATVPSDPRGDGKEIIKCDKFGCYVIKSEGKDEPEYHDESIIPVEKKVGEDFSNADGLIPATVTNTVSQSTQTAKPIKTDDKVGVPEREGGLKINVTPLEGGIADNQYTKNDTPMSSGVGGGVRAHIDDASNQDNPKDQTAQVSEKIEVIHSTILHKANVNRVIGAILAGAQRVEKGVGDVVGGIAGGIGAGAIGAGAVVASEAEEAIEEKIGAPKGAVGGTADAARRAGENTDADNSVLDKSGYTTEDGNIQLGNPSIPTENKEKLVSSMGAQNKQTKVTIREKSNYCPSCGQKRTEQSKRDYPETDKPHALCPTCDQNKRIAERDRKDDAKMESIVSGIHSDLASSGQKVTRFSSGKAPKTYNS